MNGRLVVRRAAGAVLLLCTMLACVPARAATIYVDWRNTSATTNGQSSATAWTTLATGLADLAATNALSKGGHTLLVATGTYAETLYLTASHSGLSTASNVVQAVGSVKVGSGTWSLRLYSACAVVDGFRTADTVTYAAYIPSTGVSNTIRNCILIGPGNLDNGTVYVDGQANNIENCVIGYSIYDGIVAGEDPYGLPNARLLVRNCILVGCGNYGIREWNLYGQVMGENNCFWGNGLGQFKARNGTVCNTAAAINARSGMTNNIVANPGFASLTANWSFNSLYSDSPCLNAGTGGRDLGAFQDPTPVSVSSNMYYVDASSGNDSRTKLEATNPATPWKSVTNAAAQAVAGDSVIVNPGIYDGPVTLAWSGSQQPITFRAPGGATLAGAGALILDRVNGIVVDGLSCQSMNASANAITLSYASGCALSNVTAFGASGSTASGIRLTRSQLNQFGNCQVYSNRFGIYVDNGASGNVLDGCRIWKNGTLNTHGGLAFFGRSAQLRNTSLSQNANGIYTLDAPQFAALQANHCVLASNTFYGAYVSSWYIYVALTNSVIADNRQGGVYQNPGQTFVYGYAGYCCFNNNSLTNFYYTSGAKNSAAEINGLSGWTNNIVADPLFVNAATNDFRLRTGSPCRDAGVSLPGMTWDMVGTVRPQGPAYDIGCLEAPPGGPPGTAILIR